MRRNQLASTKRGIAAAVLALFVSQASLPYGAGMSGAWAAVPANDPAAGLSLKATLKNEVALADEDLMDMAAQSSRNANVLFMVDATASMQFHPKGVMPSVVLRGDIDDGSPYWAQSENEGANWSATKSAYGYSIKDVVTMMRNATFGIGAMPVSWSGQNLHAARNLYGRDIDITNNYTKRSDNIADDLRENRVNYYAPFKDGGIAGVKAGYASQALGLEVERTGVGNALARRGEAYHHELENHERGTSETAYSYNDNTISGASKFPYALVFKNPEYWENGMTSLGIGQTAPQDELVPNDSRLYQTKLALWRLLEDQDMWANMRFGLASTYLPNTNINAIPTSENHRGLTYRYDFNGMYKVHPYGTTVWSQMTFGNPDGDNPTPTGTYSNANNTTGRVRYVNGTLNQAITGHVRGYNAMQSQYYPMWSHVTSQPLFSAITGDADEKARAWWIYFSLHRGSLLVPIRGYNEVWSKGSKPEMSQVDRVRQWINGFADLAHDRTNQWHYYKDPEIGVAGIFILPHAIYPDPRPLYAMQRSEYQKQIHTSSFTKDAGGEGDSSLSAAQHTAGHEYSRSIWYSNKDDNTDYVFHCFPYSSELEDSEQRIRNFFNAGSGEAAGSILDFFSPPTDKHSSLSSVSYPIMSACDPNWVIVITTGQELKTVDASSYQYSAAHAIKNLYDATDKKRKDMPRSTDSDKPLRGDKIYAPYEKVSMLERIDGVPSSTGPKLVDLDEPIRTLVVGIIPDAGDSSLTAAERADVEEMYVNLTKMAVAGRGGNPDMITNYNDAKKSSLSAFVANDPDSLLNAIRSALTVINDSTAVQPGSGEMAQSESLDDLDGTSDIYSYQYRIMNSNQWEATMRRDVVSMDADGTVRFYHKWTIGEGGDEEHKIIPPSGQRRVVFWNGKWDWNGLQEPLDALDSFGSAARLKSGDLIYPPPGLTTFNGIEPERAFARWLMGKDYSYFKGMEFTRSHMFTDLGQGGVAILNDPPLSSRDTLPGYNEWTAEIANASPNTKPLLYAQTNDGLLRVIDPTQTGQGREIMAILPPPMMIPSRLATLKTDLAGGDLRWLDVTGGEDIGGRRSHPAFTLDGSLQKRNYFLNGRWGKYLLGALGRGGSGLYMLDVNIHERPALMWYREAANGDKLISNSLSALNDGVPYVYGKDELTQDNSSELAYLKLGFNSPKPVMGVAQAPASDVTKKGMQNFIALAGGAMSDVPLDMEKNGDEGATLIFIDPQDGTILKAFDGHSFGADDWALSQNVVGGVPIMGMMVSEPTLFRSSQNPYMTGGVIAADNRGNIFRVDLENRALNSPRVPAEWSIKTVATLQKDPVETLTSRKSFAIPHGVVVSIQASSDNMWIAGGTADIRVKKFPDAENSAGVLRNGHVDGVDVDNQMIFSIMTGGAQTAPYTRADLKELDQDVPEDVFSINSEKSGWYFELLPEGGSENQNGFREYVSTKPLLINGTLFVATFIPKTFAIDNRSATCEPSRTINGNSRLYAVDLRTGKPTFWVDNEGNMAKFETFTNMKIVSLIDLAKGGKGKFMFRFDAFGSDNNFGDLMKKYAFLKRVKDADGNDTTSGTADDPPAKGGGITPATTIINYWLLK
jgi:hypothetical protein